MCHLNSKTRLFLSAALHTTILFHHCVFPLYAAYTVQFMEEPLKTKIMKYTLAYLTYWNFGFQVIFLLLAVGCDAAEWRHSLDVVLRQKMKFWRDVTFTGLVVPLTMFVTTMFWGVYLVDRELVYPRIYDRAVPWWFNHSVHTVTFLMIVLEALLQPRRKPVDRKVETLFYVGVSVSYAVVYYSIFFVTDVWLYRVFAVMTWWQICIYQIMIWLSIHIFYEIQFPINRLIHGSVDEHQDVLSAGVRNTAHSPGISNTNNRENTVTQETKAQTASSRH